MSDNKSFGHTNPKTVGHILMLSARPPEISTFFLHKTLKNYFTKFVSILNLHVPDSDIGLVTQGRLLQSKICIPLEHVHCL